MSEMWIIGINPLRVAVPARDVYLQTLPEPGLSSCDESNSPVTESMHSSPYQLIGTGAFDQKKCKVGDLHPLTTLHEYDL